MSTPFVRNAIVARVSELAPVPVFKVSDYLSGTKLPEECVLVDFVAPREEPISIGDPTSVRYEETAQIVLHYLYPTGRESAPFETKAEAIRLQMRSQRIQGIWIESANPFADAGTPVDDSGTWQALTAQLNYSLDDLT